MEAIKVYKYQETPITFNIGNKNGTMINATEMAKPFGKQPSDWIRLKQTCDIIDSLSTVRGIPRHLPYIPISIIHIKRNNSMEKLRIFKYNNTPISFDTAAVNGTMVNATEMAKPFGKTTKDWLRTQQSQEFISSLPTVRQICLTELVKIKQGGNDKNAQGTWMHEDVALLQVHTQWEENDRKFMYGILRNLTN